MLLTWMPINFEQTSRDLLITHPIEIYINVIYNIMALKVIDVYIGYL